MSESSKISKRETYPRYYQSTDGNQQIKVISKRSYIHVCTWKEEDFYDYRAEHKPNSEYREDCIHYNFIKSDEEEYLVKLREVTRYFTAIQINLDRLDKK